MPDPRPLPVSLGAFTLLLVAVHSPAQCDTRWIEGLGLPGVAGAVHAAHWWDPDGPGPRTEVLVVGGEFDSCYTVAARNLAIWDPATGQWSAFASQPDNPVLALAVLPNGDLVVGGRFVNVGTTPASAIARFDGTNWSPLGGGLSGYYSPSAISLAVGPGGDLFVGGLFQTVGSVAARNVARWDGAAWHALGAGVSSGPLALLEAVSAVAPAPNGDVYVSGFFELAGGSPAAACARWDGASWHPLGAGFVNGVANRIVIEPSGDAVFAGSFAVASNPQVRYAARWNGTAWSGLGTGPGAEPRSLVRLSNGELLAGLTTTEIVRWDGQTWSAVGSATGVEARALLTTPSGGYLALGWPRSQDYRAFVRWTGASWEAVSNGFDQPIRAVTSAANGDLVVGGDFPVVNQDPALAHIARYDGAAWTAIGGGVDGPVHALARLANGDLVAAGEFTSAGGVAATRIARFDGVAWHPLGSGLDGVPRALAVLANGDLIAGGSFQNSGTTVLPHVGRWDGTSWHAMGAFDGDVLALCALTTGELVAGGRFTNVNGSWAPFVARFAGGSWSSLGSWPAWWVHALAEADNGDLLVGGRFQSAGSVPCSNVARFDGSGWSPLGPGVTGSADALALLPNGDVLIGGADQTVRWDGHAMTVLGDGGVLAFGRFADDDVAAGGRSVFQQPELAAYFARLTTTCPADAASIPTPCIGPIGPLALAGRGLPWVGTTYRSTVTGFAPAALGAALLGLTSPNLPLSSIWPNALPSCNQLASSEALQLVLPTAGAAGFAFSIPNDPLFAGLPLFHQFLQFDPSNAGLPTLSASNALALTIGAF
ncbi:MAG: hypothetical protein KDE27_08905 [Planctomycetes bacterium]|nr:hypothetical protein [Planctomycetota bacterium]